MLGRQGAEYGSRIGWSAVLPPMLGPTVPLLCFFRNGEQSML